MNDLRDIETSQLLHSGGTIDDENDTEEHDERPGCDDADGSEGSDGGGEENVRLIVTPVQRKDQGDPPPSFLAVDVQNESSDKQDDLDAMIARIRLKEAQKQLPTLVEDVAPSQVGPLPSDKLHFLSRLAPDPQYQRLLSWFREQQVTISLHRYHQKTYFPTQ